MDKKALIGGILGIGLIAVLVWFLFFKKGKDGKAVANKVIPKKDDSSSKTQKNSVQPQQLVINNSGGGGGSLFPLRQGSRGNEVKMLQEALTKAGFDTKGADGGWGKNTQEAFAKAFPNKLGINDLKDLEDTINRLKAMNVAQTLGIFGGGK